MVGERKPRSQQFPRPNSKRSKKPSSADGNTTPAEKSRRKKSPPRRTKSVIVSKDTPFSMKRSPPEKGQMSKFFNKFQKSNNNVDRVSKPVVASPLRVPFWRSPLSDQPIPVPRNVTEFAGPSQEMQINPASFNPENYSELFWDGEVICSTNGDGLLQQWQLYSERVAAQLEARNSGLKKMPQKGRRKKRKLACSKKKSTSSVGKKKKKRNPDVGAKERLCVYGVKMSMDIPAYMYQDLL